MTSPPEPGRREARRRLAQEEERMIFLLHQYQRLSAERIARRMKVSVGQVRRIVSRCVRRSR